MNIFHFTRFTPRRDPEPIEKIKYREDKILDKNSQVCYHTFAMRLSTKSTYGLRAMVDLALSYKRGSISISDIAAKEDISAAYLEQLLNKLRRNNLTKSLRGPNGGYVLARRPDTITVGDVVRVLEGDTAPVYCVKNEKDAKKLCDRTKTCVTRGVWKRLAHAIDAVLDSINLEELARQAECGGKYEKSVS